MAKQGCIIPAIFHNFTGYNKPEKSKHRKRTIQNMSGNTIDSIASSLFRYLQSNYWKSSSFIEFRKQVKQLAGVLAQYSKYLQTQNKRMKVAHVSEVPICKISDALSIEMIKSSSLLYPCFISLSEEPRNHYQ